MKKEKRYLNQLIIYFTLEGHPRTNFNGFHLVHNFPTWPPSRVGKDYNTGNDEFDDINKIFSAHNIPYPKEEYCHPNFQTHSIGQIDNSILYQTIFPLKEYFLDLLPTFDIHNVIDVSFINMFSADIVLETPDMLSYMDAELYITPVAYFEIGFSYITTIGYIQRNITVSRTQLHSKIKSKTLLFPSGYLEYYIQNFMVYPYFVNQNLTIDLEHLPSK